jgi:hypothetical protein
LLASPYPKVREVSVETVAATELAGAIEPLAQLIAAEKPGSGFQAVNGPALVGRFRNRLKALKKRHGN